ncbi:MAG TPA: TraK family protein [Chloroflexota bacterium]|nr:TraK family protein [Chloroflexota bacterium]
MNQLPERKRMKGIGRVAFMAHLAEIIADLEAGWPIKAVYQKRADKLGMSYAQFARYVDQIVRRGNRGRPPPFEPPRPPLPSPAAPPPAPPPLQQGTPRAGYEPARRGFNHDPIERPDDRRRLLGEE